MVKLVLFDIDGTLVLTGGAGVKAFRRTFEEEFGLADGTERLKFAGRTDVSLVREFFSHHGVEATEEHFSRFFEKYLFRLARIIHECDGHICPGVQEFIRSLRGLPAPPLLGLLTGNIQGGARIKLAHFHLWQEFDFGAFADDHEERDRIAAIARERGSERLGETLRGEEVLIIGDTPLDIRCARAIDARVLAVGTGGTVLKELAAHQPDWLAADLTAISVEEVCG